MILNKEEIKEILPHRDPFLFVDEVIELEFGKRAKGIKYLKKDEYYLQGHFPNRPVMPGVILTEAMAQLGGIIIMQMEESKGKLAVLAGLNNFKFRNIVIPEKKILLTAEVINIKRNFGKVHAKAEFEDKIAAEGEILFSLVE